MVFSRDPHLFLKQNKVQSKHQWIKDICDSWVDINWPKHSEKLTLCKIKDGWMKDLEIDSRCLHFLAGAYLPDGIYQILWIPAFFNSTPLLIKATRVNYDIISADINEIFDNLNISKLIGLLAF